MKRIFALMFILCIGISYIFAQQDITKEEWQKQVAELTTKRDDLKNKLAILQKEVADFQKQDAEKAVALKQCQNEIAVLEGQEEIPFNLKVDAIESRLNELSRLSNQDLYARKSELDTVQAWINTAKQSPLSVLKKNQDRLTDMQSQLDTLRKSLEQVVASGAAIPTYKVGTWTKDRDCLWNIAKKPKIYDNAFLWPKIWQGNRDQIKNADIIHPGQVLKIPPKSELTKTEKLALSKYWSKKGSVPDPAKPHEEIN